MSEAEIKLERAARVAMEANRKVNLLEKRVEFLEKVIEEMGTAQVPSFPAENPEKIARKKKVERAERGDSGNKKD